MDLILDQKTAITSRSSRSLPALEPTQNSNAESGENLYPLRVVPVGRGQATTKDVA